MTTTINASPSNGLVQTADGSGILKVQSNGVTTNALAWVNFAGASGTRNASYNVSSVTRNSTGNYSINFANALSDANYVTNITLVGGNAYVGTINGQTTTTANIYGWTTASSFFDASFVGVAIFGN